MLKKLFGLFLKSKESFRSLGKIVATRMILFVAIVLVATLIVVTYSVSRIIESEYQKLLKASIDGIRWDVQFTRSKMIEDLKGFMENGDNPTFLDFAVSGDRIYKRSNKVRDEILLNLKPGASVVKDLAVWTVAVDSGKGGIFIDDRFLRKLIRDIRGSGLVAIVVGGKIIVPSFIEVGTLKELLKFPRIGTHEFFMNDQKYMVRSFTLDGMRIYVMLATGLFDKVIFSLFAILTIMFAGGIGVIFYVSQSIGKYLTKNLRMILDGFEKLREGNFEFLEIKSQDELGMIMAEFNVTVAVLKDAMEKLRMAKELAEEASKSKSMFLASVSHEIRTPLNSILGFTELLLKEEKDPRKREYLMTIYKSGEHLLNVINDILDLSKIEAGKMELVYEEYNPKELVREVVKMYQPLAMKKGINIFSEIDRDVPERAIGDTFRIKQILINLVSNAVKFTEQGYVKISLKKDGENLLYTVEDTGIGIPKDRIEKIFEPFTQADAAISRKFGGTGLGLTISKRLAKMMGGDLWMESELGKGTKVYLRIPIEVVPADAITSRATAKVSEDVVFLHVKDSNLREKVLNFLTPMGFDIVELESMKDVYVKLGSVKPRIVIVEVSSIEDVKGVLREIPTIAFLPEGSRKKVLNRVRFIPLDTDFEEFVETFKELTGIDLKEHIDLLIVEDNEVNLNLLKTMLPNILKDYSLEVAENGQEAVEKVEEMNFDLILMDAQMPVMDGYTATKKLREMGYKGIIIMATASVADSDVKKAFESGCDDFLPKPIKLDELKRKIWKYFPLSIKKEEAVEEIETEVETPEKVEEVVENDFEESVYVIDEEVEGKDEETIEVLEFEDLLENGGAVEKSIEKMVNEMGMDKDLALGMVKDYMKFLKNKLALLKKAVDSKDQMGVRRVAHDLTGSGEMYGFDKITKLGELLSKYAKMEDFETLEKLVKIFSKMIENYEKEMETVQS